MGGGVVVSPLVSVIRSSSCVRPVESVELPSVGTPSGVAVGPVRPRAIPSRRRHPATSLHLPPHAADMALK